MRQNLFVIVIVHSVKEPTNQETAYLLFEPILKPLGRVQVKANNWKKGTRFMDVNLKVRHVTVRNGS